MNRETRKERIKQITERGNPPETHRILWMERLEPMGAYDIPLECLVYNKYNGRILSRTKTLEIQGRTIDVETDEGKATIERLLWESKEGRNQTTMDDIAQKGQLKVGIVTNDGIVIDGNRRLMLLNKLKKSHFRAIVLPVALEEEPIEVERLETTYQMGEDEKLGYNPIEKYLKATQLFKKLREQFSKEEAIRKIANWMGESDGEIEDYLDVAKVIDDYLDYLNYKGIYAMADTPNDGKEDLFKYLKKWIKTFEGKGSDKGFDGYTQGDVDDLKTVCFDYIRAKIGKSYDGKIFRHIADGQKMSHFFGNKEIWTSFREDHFQFVSSAGEEVDAKYPIDYDSQNLEKSLSNRDMAFMELVQDQLTENIDKHLTKLRNKQAAHKPLKLVTDAKDSLEAIDKRHSSFDTPEVQKQLDTVAKMAFSMLDIKSPSSLLRIALQLIKSVNLSASSDPGESMSQLKEIQKTAYQMEKELKHSS